MGLTFFDLFSLYLNTKRFNTWKTFGGQYVILYINVNAFYYLNNSQKLNILSKNTKLFRINGGLRA